MGLTHFFHNGNGVGVWR